MISSKNKNREHVRGAENERQREGCVSYSMFIVRKGLLSVVISEPRIEEGLQRSGKEKWSSQRGQEVQSPQMRCLGISEEQQ